MFTFHLEAVAPDATAGAVDARVEALCTRVREAGMHVGLAVKPATPAELTAPYVEAGLVDMVGGAPGAGTGTQAGAVAGAGTEAGAGAERVHCAALRVQWAVLSSFLPSFRRGASLFQAGRQGASLFAPTRHPYTAHVHVCMRALA